MMSNPFLFEIVDVFPKGCWKDYLQTSLRSFLSLKEIQTSQKAAPMYNQEKLQWKNLPEAGLKHNKICHEY